MNFSLARDFGLTQSINPFARNFSLASPTRITGTEANEMTRRIRRDNYPSRN